MAASVGSMDQFDVNTETLSSYLECLDQQFLANEIGQCAADAQQAVKTAADKKQVATLISVMGKTAYAVLQDLCKPDLPKTQLCTAMKSH